MSNLLERYNPFQPVYGDDLNHIIDVIDGIRYNLVNIATGPSNARYVIDTTSIRAYDSTANNYGAPSGAGVTFEVSPNGNVFMGGALKLQSSQSGPYILLNMQGGPSPGVSPYESINDGTRDRVQLGNLAAYTDANGVASASGYGMRALDSSGNILFDTSGIAQVMVSMGLAAAPSTQVITAGAGATDITGTNFTFTTTRQTRIFYPVFITGYLTTSGAGNSTQITGTIGTTSTAAIFMGNSNITSGYIWYYTATLAAGTYTCKMQANATGSNFNVTQYFHQVFVLGG